MARPIFDRISGLLEDFFEANTAEIERLQHSTLQPITSELRSLVGGKLRGAAAQGILARTFAAAEREFATIASRGNLDQWLAIVRRFPPEQKASSVTDAILVRGLLNRAGDAAGAETSVNTGVTFGVASEISEDSIRDAFALVVIARFMDRVASTYRWIGKGAVLAPEAQQHLHTLSSTAVTSSVAEYERRRPSSMIFQDEGFLSPLEFSSTGPKLLLLAGGSESARFFVPGPDLWLSCPRLPVLVKASELFRLFSWYEDAIQDVMHFRVSSLFHVLAALAKLCIASFPPVTGGTASRLLLERHDGSQAYEQRLGFYFSLMQKGYLRFPLGHWVQRITEVDTPFVAQGKRKEATREVFHALTFRRGGRAQFDLMTLHPVPLMFEGASGEVYFDMTAVGDVLAELLTRAKEWFASQHGDRFTLALKQMLEPLESVRIIATKSVFASGEQTAEVDLLLQIHDRLYAVECKAFAKSREFFRGDSKAVSQRRSRIAAAVKQAQKAAAVTETAIEDQHLPLVTNRRVEWLLCTPTQEFLRPPSEFGYLADGIPRVCTPEELVEYAKAPNPGRGIYGV